MKKGRIVPALSDHRSQRHLLARRIRLSEKWVDFSVRCSISLIRHNFGRKTGCHFC
ncbi:hypothetical protein KL86PLE_90109 [uncultured Pleomorphomonas sp.]|uniref:Uncharacterized protein n=1 Tax=uncultured Pleomorphomonas sp. TaxID=442121 RepID=A0A212LMU6_9HYPH|nr:hypothetical protein KL86PLE_90109 [uncultured Pleomorphomonas sp.]